MQNEHVQAIYILFTRKTVYTHGAKTCMTQKSTLAALVALGMANL